MGHVFIARENVNRALPMPFAEWNPKLCLSIEGGCGKKQPESTNGMKASLSMQKRLGSLFRATDSAVLLCWLAVLASINVEADEAAKGEAVSLSSNAVARVEGNTAFAFELYSRLKGINGNLLFSPWSISSAMAMTYVGARENTARQLASTLHFDANLERLRAALGELRETLAKPGAGIELNVADGVWAHSDQVFLPSYLNVLNKSFGAKPRLVNFDAQAGSIAREINGWVAEQTKGQFTDVVTPESLGNLTRLVLVDTVYFKGVWETKFEPNATTDAPFYFTRSNSVSCRMMKCSDRFKYAENYPDCELIELPYGSGDLSMVVLLPCVRYNPESPGDSFPSLEFLESKLTSENLARWVGAARLGYKPIDVYLPKFSFRTTTELTNALAGMGMPDAFQYRVADFSGMTGDPNLFISMVKHDAFVEVNEEGTRAGAATEVHLRTKGISPHFAANHPFLFLIRDNRTGVVLFLGRVMDPTRT
jgi:serine protease inhibitor